MIKIAPSILSADFANLGVAVSDLRTQGADLIHIDVMDGHFVPNITIGPSVIKALRKHSDLVFDVHLMISNPENYIQTFAEAGADIITVHVEACVHLNRLAQSIKAFGKKVGVAVNPSTSLSSIECILPYVDMVLIMSVNPGFGGQKFIDNSLEKIKSLKEKIQNNNLNIQIEVDGGITLQNAKSVIEAGADILVAGSAIFNSSDIGNTIAQFKSL